MANLQHNRVLLSQLDSCMYKSGRVGKYSPTTPNMHVLIIFTRYPFGAVSRGRTSHDVVRRTAGNI